MIPPPMAVALSVSTRSVPADWTPNAKQFANALECSHRTILHDVEAFRDCGYKLDYDEADHRISWVNKNALKPLPLARRAAALHMDKPGGRQKMSHPRR